MQLGMVGGATFHASESLFAHGKQIPLAIDVVAASSGTFSLENGEYVRFHDGPRPFADDGTAALKEAGKVRRATVTATLATPHVLAISWLAPQAGMPVSSAR